MSACPPEDSEWHDYIAAWRIWLVDSADPTGLFSPYVGRTEGSAVAMCTDGHQPPALGCHCGIVGVACLLDVLYRLRVMSFNVRSNASSAVCPEGFEAGRVPVLARVTLANALVENRWAPHLKLFPAAEIRAAACRIDHVYIPFDTCPHWLRGDRFTCRTPCIDVERIARQLCDSLRVPVSIGLPPYGFEEWEARGPGYRGQSDVCDWFAPGDVRVPFCGRAPAPGEFIPGAAVVPLDVLEELHRRSAS